MKRKMTKFRQLIKSYGLVKFSLLALDHVLFEIVKFFRKRLYRWTGSDFGLKEAIFWSKDISIYLRYSAILNELKTHLLEPNHKLRILEVGAGGEGISRFLKYAGDFDKCQVYLADTNPQLLEGVKFGKPVVIEGDNLPFEDDSFDVVISVDTLEHVPKPKREHFLHELKRVCKDTILMHFVMHDPQRKFLSRNADLRFQDWYVQHFNKPHVWTAEHLKIEPPSCQEIEKTLPTSSIKGTQNVDVWLSFTKFRLRPVIGLLTGFLYMLKWKHKDRLPPFNSCLIRWFSPHL